MHTSKIAILSAGLACLLLLSACGSSSTAIQAMPNAATGTMGSGPAKYVAGTLSAGKTEIPAHIVSAVTGHLDAELHKRGLAPAADADRTIRIDATTTYYRMRSGFSRMMVGIFAGKDGIECDVQLVDKTSGQPIGQFKVKSYNMTAVGGEDDVARMLAVEIVKALQDYKP
jgi:hypothetical protein